MAEPGRPTKLTPEVRKKMEEAAALDASIPELCFYAGVTKQTYYNWKEQDPEFFDRLDELRNKPVLLARQTIMRGIAKDPNHAFRYVEKKRPKEFASTTKLEHSGAVDTNLPPEQARTAAADALRERFELELRATIVKGPKAPPEGKQVPISPSVGVSVGAVSVGERVTENSGHLTALP